MKVPGPKFFIYLTVIMPIFFSIMWILSASIDGKWTFGVNSLSDMGISENAVSAFLFNFGCIITGLFGSFIGFGMFAYGKRTIKYAGILYTISMIFLAFVGVFTLPQTMHFVVASSYGIFFALAAAVTTPSDWKVSWYLYFDIVFIVIGLIMVSTQPFPVWEAVMVIAAMVWTVVFGYKMSKEYILFSEEPDLKIM